MEAADGDAEERGAVGAVGGGSGCDADVGEAEEQRDGDHRERCDHPRGGVVGVEDEGRDLLAPVDGDVDGAGERALVPDAGDEERGEGEQLRDADGGDGEDEAWCAEEAAHERELDDRADDHRAGEADREREEVVEAGEEDEVDRERDGDESEVALREVEDAVGAVDERHAEGDERAEHADGDALDDEAPEVLAGVGVLAREEELLGDDDGDGRPEGGGEPLPSRRCRHLVAVQRTVTKSLTGESTLRATVPVAQ